jgi:hypothetical protein
MKNLKGDILTSMTSGATATAFGRFRKADGRYSGRQKIEIKVVNILNAAF